MEGGEIPGRRWARWGKTKGQRELEKEGVPDVSFKELIKLNFPDWHFVLVGVFFSAVIGALFPTISILFSEVIRVGHSLTRSL